LPAAPQRKSDAPSVRDAAVSFHSRTTHGRSEPGGSAPGFIRPYPRLVTPAGAGFPGFENKGNMKMSSSMNRITLIGNLGADPEVRNTQDGRRIVSFSVATTETWKSGGERKERTQWHKIVIFNEGLGELAEKYLTKGSKVLVEGSLNYRKWTEAAGAERMSAEIVLGAFNGTLTFLDARRAEPSEPNPRARTAEPKTGPSWDAPKGGDLDEEVPF
jgi:single-strand DNA-binding protein